MSMRTKRRPLYLPFCFSSPGEKPNEWLQRSKIVWFQFRFSSAEEMKINSYSWIIQGNKMGHFGFCDKLRSVCPLSPVHLEWSESNPGPDQAEPRPVNLIIGQRVKPISLRNVDIFSHWQVSGKNTLPIPTVSFLPCQAVNLQSKNTFYFLFVNLCSHRGSQMHLLEVL